MSSQITTATEKLAEHLDTQSRQIRQLQVELATTRMLLMSFTMDLAIRLGFDVDDYKAVMREVQKTSLDLAETASYTDIESSNSFKEEIKQDILRILDGVTRVGT